MAGNLNEHKSVVVKVSYTPLFTRLVERKIPKMEFCKLSGISPSTLAKMAKDADGIGMNIVVKACVALSCRVQDVVAVIIG